MRVRFPREDDFLTEWLCKRPGPLQPNLPRNRDPRGHGLHTQIHGRDRIPQRRVIFDLPCEEYSRFSQDLATLTLAQPASIDPGKMIQSSTGVSAEENEELIQLYIMVQYCDLHSGLVWESAESITAMFAVESC